MSEKPLKAVSIHGIIGRKLAINLVIPGDAIKIFFWNARSSQCRWFDSWVPIC